MTERMNTVGRLARGVLVGSLVSLGLMAVLAMCVVRARLSDDASQAINQAIKLLSLDSLAAGRQGRLPLAAGRQGRLPLAAGRQGRLPLAAAG